MKYSGPLKIQKISRSTKRLTTHAKRYAADEDGIFSMRGQWIKEGNDCLLKESKNRFNDYNNLALFNISLGDIQEVAFHNEKECKTHLYLGALYKLFACRYYSLCEFEGKERSACEVNLRALAYFEAAVIAGANDVAQSLGKMLVSVDQSSIPLNVQKTDSIIIHLFNGDDAKVAEHCRFVKEHQNTLWTCKSMLEEIELYEAILAGDNQRFYDGFILSLRANRRDPNLVWFLDLLHLALGKIAVQRGFELPIDTEDCPQHLLQPEHCDYNSVTAQAPVEGFPWEEY